MPESDRCNDVLVSVLCYNHGAYIEQCLESIFTQKCNFSFKVFVFDDVSTDNSWDIILRYKEIYKERMIIFRPEQNQFSQGNFNTFNKMIFDMPGYKYVAYCEADDYWQSASKLQKQYDCMEKSSSCSLCVCATDFFDDVQKKMMAKVSFSSQDRIIPGDKLIDNTLKWSCLFEPNTYFMRKSCFEDIDMDTKFWNYVASDMMFTLFLATQGDIIYLSECMAVKRRYNTGSISEKIVKSEFPSNRFDTDVEWASAFNVMTNGEYEDSVKRYILWRKIRSYYMRSGEAERNQYVNNSNGKLYKTELFRKVNRLFIRTVKLFYMNDEIKFAKRERYWMEKEWKRLQKKESGQRVG